MDKNSQVYTHFIPDQKEEKNNSSCTLEKCCLFDSSQQPGFGILLISPIYKAISYLKYKNKPVKHLVLRIVCSSKCLEP